MDNNPNIDTSVVLGSHAWMQSWKFHVSFLLHAIGNGWVSISVSILKVGFGSILKCQYARDAIITHTKVQNIYKTFCLYWFIFQHYVLTLFLISCIETLPEVKTDLRPYGPREDSSLSEFQLELIQLASQLNGDHVLNSYPNIGKSMTVGEANRYAEDAVKRFLEAGRAALKAGANDSAIVTMRPSLTSRVAVADHRKQLESYWFFHNTSCKYSIYI